MTIRKSSFMFTLALGLMTTVVGAMTTLAQEPDSADHAHDTTQTIENKIAENLSARPEVDQKLAKEQRFCSAMTYDRLGSMGTPLKVTIEGKPVFLCCKGCVEDAKKEPAKTLKIVAKLRESTETLAKLSAEDRTAAEAQKYCAVANTSFLGSMGAPIKLEIDGKSVFLCCDGCTKKAKSDPKATLAKAQELVKAGTHKGHDHSAHGDESHKH